MRDDFYDPTNDFFLRGNQLYYGDEEGNTRYLIFDVSGDKCFLRPADDFKHLFEFVRDIDKQPLILFEQYYMVPKEKYKTKMGRTKEKPQYTLNR